MTAMCQKRYPPVDLSIHSHFLSKFELPVLSLSLNQLYHLYNNALSFLEYYSSPWYGDGTDVLARHSLAFKIPTPPQHLLDIHAAHIIVPDKTITPIVHCLI